MMINANCPQESLYSILNENLRFTLYEQNFYLKQNTLMTYNNLKKAKGMEKIKAMLQYA